jgi:hypothetical protein
LVNKGATLAVLERFRKTEPLVNKPETLTPGESKRLQAADKGYPSSRSREVMKRGHPLVNKGATLAVLERFRKTEPLVNKPETLLLFPIALTLPAKSTVARHFRDREVPRESRPLQATDKHP